MKRILSMFALASSLALAAVFAFGTNEVHAQNANCNVTNIEIRPSQYAVENPNGDEDGDGESNFIQEYFKDYYRPYFYVDFQTSGCLDADSNYDFKMSLYLRRTGIDVIALQSFEEKPVDVPSDSFTWAFKAGESGCDLILSDPECVLYVSTTDGNSQEDEWPDTLEYDCDVDCTPAQVFQYIDSIPYGTNVQDDQPGVTPGAPGGQATISSEAYLAPLPGLAGQEAGLQGFLQGLFNVLIVIAGILAILMIVIGAITYVSADSLGGTENGRKMVGAAIMGLVIALGGWVLINTINPNLASNLMIKIPKVNMGNYSTSAPGVINTNNIPDGVTPNENPGTSASGSICKDKTFKRVPNCPTCQPIPSGVSINNGSNNKAIPAVGSKLLALENALSGVNWVVTEAFEPTRHHCGKCHYLGTCVDADFSGLPNPTPAQVRSFIDAAKSVGLKAEWEVKTQAEFDAMVAAGLKPKDEVWKFGSWISGSHFSIYND